ncbi:hypothetical protein EYF80_043688 [Liparis tanakae]|uniref:Uncharacterized protein n=1 Tax=Liparis tanakae TaxID=230148 RepID=A0A4Z2FYN5_9TELE|nr:hypothetical protein EYF80_043688 [Liparis tanakae]
MERADPVRAAIGLTGVVSCLTSVCRLPAVLQLEGDQSLCESCRHHEAPSLSWSPDPVPGPPSCPKRHALGS